MPSYHQDNIKQQESMAVALEQNIRIWDIPGLHIKVEYLPENATIQKAFAMLSSSGNWHAGISWTVEGHTGTYMASIVKCASLQELLDKVPEFFELDGNLDIFA